MAEFMDIIHTIRRICMEQHGECFTCALGKHSCPNNVRFDETDEIMFKKLEDYVLRWKMANPEPIYPSWGEWLLQQGIVLAGTESRNGFTYQTISKKFFEQIDPDTAQRLRIEPKEKV